MERRKDNKGRVLKQGEGQRKNGTYIYRYQTKSHKTVSIYAKTLEELRKKELEISSYKHDKKEITSGKITLNDMYELWKKIKRGLKKNTFCNYQYMYEHFVQEDFGKTPLVDIRKSDVKLFYSKLVEKQHMSPSTVDSIHSVIHQVLEIAIDDDYIRINPSDNALKELKLSNKGFASKKKALTIEEQNLFIEYLDGNRYRRWLPLFDTLLELGLRIGEATGLQWEDIDFDNNVIHINNTLVYYDSREMVEQKKCIYEIHSTKTTNSQRTLPLTERVKNNFLLEKEFQKELGLQCKSVIMDPNGKKYNNFVFLNKDGNVLNNGVCNKAITRIRKDCNENQLRKGSKILLPKFSNHTLRHTYCTRLVEAGLNMKAIQAIMGHADIRTTMDIYADATEELKFKAIKEYELYTGKIKKLPKTYSLITQ